MSIRNFFNKIHSGARVFFKGLFIGMRNTEDNIMLKGSDGAGDSGIHKEVHDKRVSKALLKGEVTQEVVDLRYRTYLVERESKKYEFFSPFLVQKKSEKEIEKLGCMNSDGHDIILVQPNHVVQESVAEALDRLDCKDKVSENYIINITRSFPTRYRLEEYTHKVVVKLGDTDSDAIVDFYVTKYINKSDFKSAAFVHEIERMVMNGRNSDILSFDDLYFETLHAWNCPDMYTFKFSKPVFRNCVEFDGSYVLSFDMKVVDGGTDITKEYYSEEMAKKYENKESRNQTIDLLDYACNTDYMEKVKRKYVCEECGKEIEYDPVKIDELDPVVLKDDDETQTEDEELPKTNVTGFYDAELSKTTFGKFLCHECMMKQLSELQIQKAEELEKK